jgi:hypothetical protein
MGFFNFLRRMFGGNSTAAKAARIEHEKEQSKKFSDPEPVSSSQYPLNVDINRFIAIDQVTLDLIRDKTKFLVPTLNEQQISAIGQIDLGQGMTLYRIYLDDGVTWIQFACSGGITLDSIDEVSVFSYNNNEIPTTDAQLSRLVGPSSAVGLPTYSYDNATYERVWGSEEGQTELVPYTEFVRNEQGEEYEVQHSAMLYSRNLENTKRNELVVISVEECEGENGNRDISVTTSVGVTLQTTDLFIH